MTKTLTILTLFLCTLASCSSQQKVDKEIKRLDWTEGEELKNEYRGAHVALSTTDNIYIVGGDNEGAFTYTFDNCIVRVDDLLDQEGFQDFMDHCNDCITFGKGDILFQNVDTYDYRLDTMSVAEQKGTPIPGIFDDIDMILRDVVTPDIGCYEFQ